MDSKPIDVGSNPAIPISININRRKFFMAKEKKFTDIEIMFCGKKCHFNRVTNQTLTAFTDKAEKDYEKMVKTWTDKADQLVFQGEKLEKEIARKEKRMELLEKLDDGDVEELLEVNDQLAKLEEDLEEIRSQIMEHNNKNPIKQYTQSVDKLLAEKSEMLLDNITTAEYERDATPKDSSIARNLEKYYQMAMVGERTKKIENEIEEDMIRFLKDQEERFREQQ